jgi:hypothetical protein
MKLRVVGLTVSWWNVKEFLHRQSWRHMMTVLSVFCTLQQLEAGIPRRALSE